MHNITELLYHIFYRNASFFHGKITAKSVFLFIFSSNSENLSIPGKIPQSIWKTLPAHGFPIRFLINFRREGNVLVSGHFDGSSLNPLFIKFLYHKLQSI